MDVQVDLFPSHNNRGTAVTMSKNENSELLDGSKGLVRIVGLFDLTLNVEGLNVEGFMWSLEDIDEPTARGSFNKGLVKKGGDVVEIAYIMAADVTNDPDEPLIENMTDELVSKIDKQLEIDLRTLCKNCDLPFLEWEGSQVGFHQGKQCLISKYSVDDPLLGERHRIALRTTHNGKKIAMECSYNVRNEEDLIEPITNILLNISFVTLH